VIRDQIILRAAFLKVEGASALLARAWRVHTCDSFRSTLSLAILESKFEDLFDFVCQLCPLLRRIRVCARSLIRRGCRMTMKI